MKVGSVSAVVHHQDLGLQRHADGDVAVGAVDRPEDGPDIVLVGHLDDLVARRAPQAVVVADDQLEGDLAAEVTALGVGLLDGELRAVQHFRAQGLFVAPAAGGHGDGGLDRADEADLHRFHVVRLGDRAARVRCTRSD